MVRTHTPSGRADWAITTAHWTAGYDLTQPAERARFRVRVTRETLWDTVDQIRQAARDLGVPNPPGDRDTAQRALADIIINRWLLERRGARLVNGVVHTEPVDEA